MFAKLYENLELFFSPFYIQYMGKIFLNLQYF